jgi:signal transduction histidine kinase
MVPEHVSLSMRLGADVPNIVADPGQLDQVLLNLVAHARDAMPAGGELQIETSTTTLHHPEQLPPLPPGKYATLRVKDSGHGMSAETQERVFEPFFTTKSPALGTGLGLATVYGIVKQHGGHIVVESEPDQGSSFSLFFPATAEAVSGHERWSPTSTSPSWRSPPSCLTKMLAESMSWSTTSPSTTAGR